MSYLRQRVNEEQWQDVVEALEPPNRIDPLTGLPYGWDEDDELSGFEAILTG